MDTITLSPATPRDIDRIMTLEEQGFDSGNRELRAVYEGRIRVFPQGALMAHSGGNCIGCLFCEIWRASRRPLVEHFALGHDILERHEPLTGTELYISSMTVSPAFRGKGMGAQLLRGGMDHAARKFPQLTSAVLLVNETWERARAIYEAAGFREVVRFERFFNPRAAVYEDGLVMRCPIAGG